MPSPTGRVASARAAAPSPTGRVASAKAVDRPAIVLDPARRVAASATGLVSARSPGAGQRPNLGQGGAGGRNPGAFSGMNEGRSAQQFSNWGAQSRQVAAASRGGGRAAGGGRGGGGGGRRRERAEQRNEMDPETFRQRLLAHRDTRGQPGLARLGRASLRRTHRAAGLCVCGGRCGGHGQRRAKRGSAEHAHSPRSSGAEADLIR